MRHRDKAAEQLPRQILELNGMWKQANSRPNSVRGVLREKAARLNAATDLAVKRLRDVREIYHDQSTSLVGEVDQASWRAEEATELFRS